VFFGTKLKNIEGSDIVFYRNPIFTRDIRILKAAGLFKSESRTNQRSW
tara:strand:+ start:13211 stop:13354 length:144 start_codon:yes stop_codon:yes gene_type:complete